ncbi:LicD family protein [Bombiscardovia apis]|nr:LicD family protein [Bombiscardovia apis]
MVDRKQELTSGEIQVATLDIFKKFIEICNSQELHYYVAYGSLIGVVRHQGFIPWDDDLDIWMPRPDYNKLLQYFDNARHDTGSLVALHPSEDNLIPFLITRVSDTRYKQIGEYGDEIPQMGTFIDIYPLDGLRGNQDEALKENEDTYSLTMKYVHALNSDSFDRSAGQLKRILKKVRAAMMKSPAYYWRELCKRATVEEYEQAEYVSCKIWNDDNSCKVIDKKSDFGEGKLATFEGLQVRIPDNADAILQRIYGNYMKLPPEEERVGHHFYSIVSRGQK